MNRYQITKDDNIVKNISSYMSYFGTSRIGMYRLSEDFMKWCNDNDIIIFVYQIAKPPKEHIRVDALENTFYNDVRYDIFFEFDNDDQLALFKLSWS